jgi:hypothetical protein
MFLNKFFSIFFIFFLFAVKTVSADSFSFTYNGPTSVVTPFGNYSTANAVFTFTYHSEGTIVVPKLTIHLNGTLLIGALCEGNAYTPTSYTFVLPVGTHTIKFVLSDQPNHCSNARIWQTEEFTITCKFPIKFENKFMEGTNGGTIKVDNVTRNSPYIRPSFEGDHIIMGAIEQNYLSYQRIWNTSGNSLSYWEKERYGQQPEHYSFLQSPLAYTVQSDDRNTTFRDFLRTRYDISRIDKTEFDGTLLGEVFNIVEGNTGTITAPLTQTINSRLYYFVGWSDGVENNERIITATGNIDFTALYKIANKSNTQNAFNNSQRKFIRTPDGNLHLVYESMNRVWYERSSDNGLNWVIVKNYGADHMPARLPQIDFIVRDNKSLVTIEYILDRGDFDFWRKEVFIYNNGLEL